MQNLRDFLPSFLEVVIGLVGGAAASWYISSAFHKRSRSESKLAYRSSSYSFLSQKAPSPDIVVTFRGQEVPLITKSIVSIWNDGTTTIDHSQIVLSDPLRIVIIEPAESEILDVTILRVTREVNRFSAEKYSAYQVRCDFSWLDPGDGALIQVLHSGEKGLSVEGTLKGIPKGVAKLGGLLWVQPKKRRTFSDVVALFVVWAFFVLSLLMFGNLFRLGLQKYSINNVEGLGFMVIGGLLFFIVVGLASYGIKENRRTTPQTPYPDTLRLQEGDW